MVGCIEDLRRFSGISAIWRLGSGRSPISEIQVARRELNHGPPAPQSKSLTTRPPLFPILLVYSVSDSFVCMEGRSNCCCDNILVGRPILEWVLGFDVLYDFWFAYLEVQDMALCVSNVLHVIVFNYFGDIWGYVSTLLSVRTRQIILY